jgi:hypothetical protein
MAIGKYISLEEARNAKQLDRFAKEHPSKGDKKKFVALLDRMARNLPTAGRTSK